MESNKREPSTAAILAAEIAATLSIIKQPARRGRKSGTAGCIVDMMGEPVEQRAGKPFRAEYGSPFIERQAFLPPMYL